MSRFSLDWTDVTIEHVSTLYADRAIVTGHQCSGEVVDDDSVEQSTEITVVCVSRKHVYDGSSKRVVANKCLSISRIAVLPGISCMCDGDCSSAQLGDSSAKELVAASDLVFCRDYGTAFCSGPSLVWDYRTNRYTY